MQRYVVRLDGSRTKAAQEARSTSLQESFLKLKEKQKRDLTSGSPMDSLTGYQVLRKALGIPRLTYSHPGQDGSDRHMDGDTPPNVSTLVSSA